MRSLKEQDRASLRKVGRWYEMSPTFPSSGKPLPKELMAMGSAVDKLVQNSFSSAQLEAATKEAPPEGKTLDQALKPVAEVLKEVTGTIATGTVTLAESLTAFLKKHGGITIEGFKRLGDKIGKAIIVLCAGINRARQNPNPRLEALSDKIKSAEAELRDLDKEVAASGTPENVDAATKRAIRAAQSRLGAKIIKRAESSLEAARKKSEAETGTFDWKQAARDVLNREFEIILNRLLHNAKGALAAEYTTKEEIQEEAERAFEEQFGGIRLIKHPGGYSWGFAAGDSSVNRQEPKMVDRTKVVVKEECRPTSQIILEDHRKGRKSHIVTRNLWWQDA